MAFPFTIQIVLRTAIFTAALACASALAQHASQRATAAGADQAILQARDFLKSNDISKAEAALESALAIQERTLGRDHLDVAASLDRLAMLSLARQDFDRAETLYLRALAIREKTLGRDHVGVARSLDNLARLHVASAEDPNPEEAKHVYEAMRLLSRSLAIREKALGRNHPDVAVGLYNLALQYSWRTGCFREAPRLYRRALAIREKAFGVDSVPVVEPLIWLADYAARCWRWEHGALSPSDALVWRKRALAIEEKAYGPESPRLLENLAEIAHLVSSEKIGPKADAEPFLLRALAIQEKAFASGAAFDPTFNAQDRTLDALALLYKDLDRADDARRVAMRRLAIRESRLDEKGLCRTFKRTRNYSGLVDLFDRQGNTEGVEKLGRGELDSRAAEGRSGFLQVRCEPDFPALSIGADYEKLGEYEAAARAYTRALTAAERSYGVDNVRISKAANGLARAFERLGRYDEAEALRKRLLVIFEAKFEDPYFKHDYFSNVDSAAALYIVSGRPGKAEPLLRHALELAKTDTKSQTPGTLVERLDALAALLARLGQDAEAERLLKRAFDVMQTSAGSEERQSHGGAEKDIILRLDKLAAFYESRGRYDQAEICYRRALDIDLRLSEPTKPGMFSVNLWGPPDPQVAKRLENFAAFRRKRGDNTEADQLEKRALALRATELERDMQNASIGLSSKTSEGLYDSLRLVKLVPIYRDLGRFDDAERAGRRLTRIWEAAYGRDDSRTSLARALLAGVLDERGRHAEAEAVRADSTTTRRKTSKPRD